MKQFRVVMMLIAFALSMFWGWVMRVATGWGGFGPGAFNFFGYGFTALPVSFFLAAVWPRRWLLGILAVVNLLSAFVAIYITVQESIVVGLLLTVCVATWYIYSMKMMRRQSTSAHAGG